MAIRKTVTIAMGSKEPITVPDAYIRVNSLSGSRHNMTAHVGIYRDKPIDRLNADGTRQEVPTSGGEFVATQHHSFVPSMGGKNFFAQAYDHLKTLPEFNGALDC
jgi:hypothetical protein